MSSTDGDTEEQGQATELAQGLGEAWYLSQIFVEELCARLPVRTGLRGRPPARGPQCVRAQGVQLSVSLTDGQLCRVAPPTAAWPSQLVLGIYIANEHSS